MLPAGYTFADYSSGGQQLSGRTYDANGNLTSASGTNSSGATWSENLNGDNSTFTYNGQQYSGPTLASGAGLTLGSTIGGILGGNSLTRRIAGAAVIGTLGQSVGNILSRSGLGTALLGNGSLDPSLFDSAVTTTVANFGGNLGVNAIGDIAGSFSSLLFGEAAQALGLHGFAGGLFTTIGTSITSQLAMNLGSMALNAIGITNNFVAGSFVGNISGSIGGYFGSYLAAEIVPATGIASSIGGRIGGAIGGFLTSEIPVVGTFFGSLVGSVLGTLVGSLFDPHVTPWSSEMVGAVNGVLGINYWNWNSAGNPDEFTSLSNMVAGNANQVLALTRRDPAIMNITGLTSLNELVFNQNGSTLTAIYPDGNSTNFYVDGMPQWFALQALFNTSEIATYELVQHAVLVGSDPITTGALAAARVQDTTTPAIYADLRVAQDYERYRANAEIINTAMAANPDSDFTAGWNVTLMRARGLGLDRIVNYPGWTADLTDSHETIRDANGNFVQQLQFNADGTVATDTGTAVFNFNFVDSHLSYGSDGHTYLTGPDGAAHDVTGATRLFFNDGHIDEADGTPLVDDLYYDSQYHDVYLARIDPDAHYAANGWHEGRNPNASFDTNYYLSNNPDVAASGVNPLDQYDASGWQQGRNPSARFSTSNYLRAYPSVAATGTDPIVDFMQRGFAETVAGIGDFNRDGTSDVLWYNPAANDTAVSLLSNGQVASGVDVGPHPPDYQIVGVGDFNLDGTSDVLWSDTSTTATDVWILSNGGWAGSVNVGTHPAGYQVAGVGDFNHDGMSDVLWYNPATTQTDLWMLSNGVWTNSVITGPHPAGYRIAGIGDFNRDGMSDVLWYNSSTGATDIWLLSNGQWGASVITGPAPQGYQIAGVADFNHDGMSDVLWYNPSTTDTALWILNNGAWAGSIDIGPHPAGYQVGGAGDFNHDGMNDVLWYNPSTRNADVWLLNNGNWAGSVIIGTQR